MKIKWGALVVDGRGKLGGHVAQDGLNGSFLRTKTTPINRQSMAQARARSAFGYFSQKWSGLTESQRIGFNDAVESWKETDIFGDVKKPSGKTLFSRLNGQASAAGYTSLITAALKSYFTSPIPTSATFDVSSSSLSIIGINSTASLRLLLSSTGNVNKGGSSSTAPYLNFYNTQGNIYIPTDRGANYIAKFGDATVEDFSFLKIQYVNANGQTSLPVYLNIKFVP